jgi:predicted O-methyltransferase YrrM
VSDKELNWKYTDDVVSEPESIVRARQQSLELGIEPISPAIGAQVAVIAAAHAATSIVEIGTGAGVSGLWLLAGAPDATLTSIDSEVENQQHARTNLLDAGIAANRIRLIAGRAADVLPRMNENSYDVVFIDADPQSVIEYVEHGLRLAKPGGSVLVPHALWRGRVADPTQRDETASGFRSLIAEISASSAVLSAVSPAGDGLLQIAKLRS